jgi:hypothetical protein
MYSQSADQKHKQDWAAQVAIRPSGARAFTADINPGFLVPGVSGPSVTVRLILLQFFPSSRNMISRMGRPRMGVLHKE